MGYIADGQDVIWVTHLDIICFILDSFTDKEMKIVDSFMFKAFLCWQSSQCFCKFRTDNFISVIQ